MLLLRKNLIARITKNMWRINSDNWERKKNYLIRSLFQDLPLLSPVPESRESSCSTAGITSRPYSPLPPLIIERMPNRHDEPPEFYSELERKMKKVYRKLLYNEDSSSIDSLLDRYDRDYIAHDSHSEAIVDEQDEATLRTTNIDSDDENNNIQASIEGGSKDLVNARKKTDNLSLNADDMYNLEPELINNDIDNQSSEDTPLVSTQVTTQATVHTPPINFQDEHFKQRYLSPVYGETDCDKSLSPVLTCQRWYLKKKLGHIERIDSESNTASKDLPSDNNQDIQTAVDRESSESDLRPQNETREEDTSNTSKRSSPHESVKRLQHNISPSLGSCTDIHDLFNDSVEVMRRQKTISPSLGSLKDHHEDDLDTTFNKNIVFNRRTSSKIYSNGKDSTTEAEDREVSFEYDDFYNIMDTPSPKTKRKWKSISNKRLNELFAASETEFVTKRLKFKQTGVQTSVVCDEDETSDWDYMKRNFFVGLPKVYKLCTCRNHLCGDH